MSYCIVLLICYGLLGPSIVHTDSLIMYGRCGKGLVRGIEFYVNEFVVSLAQLWPVNKASCTPWYT